MTLEEAMAIEAWAPLSSVPVAATEVIPHVHRVTDHCYLRTVSSAKGGGAGSDGPYVTLLYWTEHESALRRIVARDSSVVTYPCESVPSVLVRGTPGSYRDLKSLVEPRRAKIAESAAYNMQGHFLCRELSMPPYKYSFESLKAIDSALPCLITMKLRDVSA